MLIVPCTSLEGRSALAMHFSISLLLLRDRLTSERRAIKVVGFPVGVFKGRLIALEHQLGGRTFSCSLKDVRQVWCFLTSRIAIYSVKMIQMPLMII